MFDLEGKGEASDPVCELLMRWGGEGVRLPPHIAQLRKSSGASQRPGLYMAQRRPPTPSHPRLGGLEEGAGVGTVSKRCLGRWPRAQGSHCLPFPCCSRLFAGLAHWSLLRRHYPHAAGGADAPMPVSGCLQVGTCADAWAAGAVQTRTGRAEMCTPSERNAEEKCLIKEKFQRELSGPGRGKNRTK